MKSQGHRLAAFKPTSVHWTSFAQAVINQRVFNELLQLAAQQAQLTQTLTPEASPSRAPNSSGLGINPLLMRTNPYQTPGKYAPYYMLNELQLIIFTKLKFQNFHHLVQWVNLKMIFLSLRIIQNS